MIFSFLFHTAFAEPVFVPKPEVRGAATQAHVDDFFRTLTKELSIDKTMELRETLSLSSFRGESATQYMKSCLPGESAGCAFSLADANEIPLLLSTTFESNKEFQAVIVRVQEGTVVRETIAAGTPDEQAQKLVVLFTKVHNNTYTPPKKEGKKEEERTSSIENEEDLSYLEAKLPPIRLRQDEKKSVRLTKAEVEEMKKEEGSKEWDRYNMGPDEFMRFINSGISLSDWKNLKQGRKNKFMIRGGGGLAFLPAHALYYGRTVYSDVDTTLVEAYAWQIPQSDVSVVYQAAISYGLTPELDVGVGFGRATGRVTMDMWSQKAGQTPYFRKENLSNPVLMIEPEISFVPRITSIIRPIMSAGVSFLFGRSTELDVATFTRSFSCRYYPQYDANNQCITSGVYEATAQTPFITQLRLQPGIEMSLNRNLDVWVRTPFSFVLFSNNTPDVIQEGGGALPERERDLPGGFSTVGFGVLFGVQTRIDPIAISKRLFDRN